ncbi:MAG: ribosome small subunit-dependent GTPase A [Verrucomicrobia bacterium]|nr:ribosome small subunit-dependent GTPase A [Verrucomicrobiota bacterium]
MSDKHIDMEELLHPERLKDSRVERKRKAKGDRSKYKKSNIKPQTYQAPKEGQLRGRVLSISGLQSEVDVDGVSYACVLRGALKQEKRRLKNLIAVGDFVLIEPTGLQEGAVVSVEERTSILCRAETQDQKRQHLLAANVDQVLITVSCITPPLRPSLIDRYIIATRKGKMRPVVLLNKVDLLAQNELEKKLVEEVIVLYRELGIPVIPLSVTSGDGIDQLKEQMKGCLSVFSGQSGVGKSSLINATCGLNLLVGEMVAATKKGSHTTTRAHLIRLPQGGFCIDTPGIKSFGLWQLEPAELKSHFSEIDEVGQRCKFQSCTHTHEPKCAVKEAVEEGKIHPLRYVSYCALLEELKDQHLRR